MPSPLDYARPVRGKPRDPFVIVWAVVWTLVGLFLLVIVAALIWPGFFID